MHYRQQAGAKEAQFLELEKKRLITESVKAQYDKHFQKGVFNRQVQERFKEKFQIYEQNIQERRQKLKELFCKEEQEFIQATVDVAQKNALSKLEDLKSKAELLKAQREAERLEIVNQKRTLQLMNDCQELRPVLIQRNLIDCKNSQLQQMKENVKRKEAEKELNTLWYKVMLAEIEAKTERETQDLLKKNKKLNENLEIWRQQIEAGNLHKQEIEKNAAKDQAQMLQIQEELRQEKIQALQLKIKKREQIANELFNQIQIQEKYIVERQKEENILNQAYNKLALEEIEKEKNKRKDMTYLAKQEMTLYQNHSKELVKEKQTEEKELQKLVQEHQKIIEKKNEEAFCQVKLAKEQLRENVLAERARQIEYKKQEQAYKLKLKEDEAEMIKLITETNMKLQKESNRLQAEKTKQYREELKQQIERNNKAKVSKINLKNIFY